MHYWKVIEISELLTALDRKELEDLVKRSQVRLALRPQLAITERTPRIFQRDPFLRLSRFPSGPVLRCYVIFVVSETSIRKWSGLAIVNLIVVIAFSSIGGRFSQFNFGIVRLESTEITAAFNDDFLQEFRHGHHNFRVFGY